MSRRLFLMRYPSNEGVSRSKGRILTFLCSSTPMSLCQHAAQGQGSGWGRGGGGRLHLSDIELLGFIWGMVWQDKPNKQSRGVNWSLLQVRWVRGIKVRGRTDRKGRYAGGNKPVAFHRCASGWRQRAYLGAVQKKRERKGQAILA